MRYAQDYLKPTASGECRCGFNSRLHGYSFSKTMDGITQGFRWGQRANGWEIADRMIREGKIFSQIKQNDLVIEFKCYADGNEYCCIGPTFTNLQESDDFIFGDTFDEAVENYMTKLQQSMQSGS